MDLDNHVDECKKYTVQFPDLTEIYYSEQTMSPSLKMYKTEFIFYLNAHAQYLKDSLKERGFQDISTMNNWWPSHSGEERSLTLWWMKNPNFDPQAPVVVERRKWWYSSFNSAKYRAICNNLAGSGCGFKIAEPPLSKAHFHKFFTLLRMPLVINPVQLLWMKKYNFRQFDTGTKATFWINGWAPEEYTIEKEYEYFKTNKREWSRTGHLGGV